MKRILAVDDERTITRLIQVNLQKQGHQVRCAFDGEEAMKMLRQERFDMVICDVMMPRKDGFEVLAEIQGDPELCGIPVIMLTAKAQDMDVFKGWSTGAACYLTKPFNSQELIHWIDLIFQQEQREPDGARVFRI